MPIFRLTNQPRFPPPAWAEEDGLLAVGGKLSPSWLLNAYSAGIFPWYSEGQPLLWWSPDPRLVLRPEWFHQPRSLRKTIRQQRLTVTFDCAFPQVIHACGQARQATGTWITPEMEQAYIQLHKMGYAHSVEAWVLEADHPTLAGGLYGIALGRCFFGESMFHYRTDASKVAFACLVERLQQHGFQMIDCQMATAHLLRFGAREIPRSLFLTQLAAAINSPTNLQQWR